jgi:hypothetical protein
MKLQVLLAGRNFFIVILSLEEAEISLVHASTSEMRLISICRE